MTDDPLTALIVDESTRIDRARQLLASILKPYVEISSQSGELSLLSAVFELPPQDQILVVMCGRLAQKLLNKLPDGQDEKISQTEVMNLLPAIPDGTIKSSLKKLREENLIMNEDRKNFISLGHLVKIQKRLSVVGGIT